MATIILLFLMGMELGLKNKWFYGIAITMIVLKSMGFILKFIDLYIKEATKTNG